MPTVTTANRRSRGEPERPSADFADGGFAADAFLNKD